MRNGEFRNCAVADVNGSMTSNQDNRWRHNVLLRSYPTYRFTRVLNPPNPYTFRHYDKSRKVLGKTMAEHLRIAVCYWHSFVWPGSDVFGQGTFQRPWQQAGNELERAYEKADSAFEFFQQAGHAVLYLPTTPMSPLKAAALLPMSTTSSALPDYLQKKQEESGVALLWGTAKSVFASALCRRRRHQSQSGSVRLCRNPGRARPERDPATGRSQLCAVGRPRKVTTTLLNTDLKREREQFARFLHLVVSINTRSVFKGALLIEPKPQEPTKHQYDL